MIISFSISDYGEWGFEGIYLKIRVMQTLHQSVILRQCNIVVIKQPTFGLSAVKSWAPIQ